MIANDDEHARALARIEELWGAEPGTDAAAERDRLVDEVVAYEDEHTTLGKDAP